MASNLSVAVYSLPVRPTAEVVTATRTDKKSRGGHVEFALPRALGEMAGSETKYGVRVNDAETLRALEHL